MFYTKESACNAEVPSLIPGKILWRRNRLSTPVFLDFPDDSAGKESACNVWDLGLIPGLGRSPGEGKGYPLQYSGLENSMDWIVHGVTKSRSRLSDGSSLLLCRFSLVVASGAALRCSVRASHCGGFSWARALGAWASEAVVHRLSSCTWA